jgi:hypothetical protein
MKMEIKNNKKGKYLKKMKGCGGRKDKNKNK